MSDDERKRLLDACKASDNEHLYPVVVFALSTGARKGEILGLTLSDLDPARDTAILRDTKNGDTRAAPVVLRLRTVLEGQIAKVTAFYEALEGAPKTRWLFPRRDGLEPIDIRKAWENARDAAKLDRRLKPRPRAGLLSVRASANRLAEFIHPIEPQTR